jgi:hypothetical protein
MSTQFSNPNMMSRWMAVYWDSCFENIWKGSVPGTRRRRRPWKAPFVKSPYGNETERLPELSAVSAIPAR